MLTSTRVSTTNSLSAPIRSSSPSVWRNLRRHRGAVIGLTTLGVLALLAVVGPLVSPYDPMKQRLSDALFDPSLSHPFGTDYLGRDLLTRMLYGGRYTLAIGFLASAVGACVGVPLGAISGFYGGRVDLVIQRFIDLMLSFPGFLLGLSLVAILGIGLQNVIISVGIASTPSFVRLSRASTLSIRELTYIEAARALGVRSPTIIFRHVLPNALAPVIVQATLSLGSAILTAAGLGFLGLGVQAPTPEWGTMLGEGRNYIFSNPNMVTFPGLAIFAAVLSFNILGDGLRDALDPRLRKR